jgi:hypothetical protein
MYLAKCFDFLWSEEGSETSDAALRVAGEGAKHSALRKAKEAVCVWGDVKFEAICRIGKFCRWQRNMCCAYSGK